MHHFTMHFTFDVRLGLGLAAESAAMLLGQSEDANCMPKRKERATVPEVQLEEITAASILSAPMAQAHPLPQGEVQMCHAVDATPPSSSKKCRATSRVYEAFKQDPTDNSRYICQSTEDVIGGARCV